MSTFKPTTKACHPRCVFLDDIIITKMSYKWVLKFGLCTGTKIKPNRNLSGWPYVRTHMVNNIFCPILDHACVQSITPCDGKLPEIKVGVIFRPEERKNKQTWGYFPSTTDEKKACRCYFPFMWTEIYVLKALFSVSSDRKVSKPKAIFRPPLTKK